MKEIIELNKRLLRDNRKHLPPGGLMLARRDAPEEWRSFHPSHGEEIEDLRSRLNEVLPRTSITSTVWEIQNRTSRLVTTMGLRHVPVVAIIGKKLSQFSPIRRGQLE
jgi:hypothetical protein